MSHIRAVLSAEDEASHLPSGDHARLVMVSEWPVRVAFNVPSETFHSLILTWTPAEASRVLSGENTRLSTEFPLADQVLCGAGRAPGIFHSEMAHWSSVPLAAHLASGEIAKGANSLTALV